jgi:hypothetical protein
LATAALSARLSPPPGLLHGVLALGRRAKHAIGDAPEPGAVRLEGPGEKIRIIHVTPAVLVSS